MDPNTALAELRQAIEDNDMDRTSELFTGLDGWLIRGGFLPADWAAGR